MLERKEESGQSRFNCMILKKFISLELPAVMARKNISDVCTMAEESINKKSALR